MHEFWTEKKIIWKKISEIFSTKILFCFFLVKLTKWGGIHEFDAWNRITKWRMKFKPRLSYLNLNSIINSIFQSIFIFFLYFHLGFNVTYPYSITAHKSCSMNSIPDENVRIFFLFVSIVLLLRTVHGSVIQVRMDQGLVVEIRCPMRSW